MIQNRSIISIWYLIAFILLLIELAPGQVLFETRTDSMIQAGIELSIQHDYATAESIFQRLIEQEPANPAGYFFMAATIQARMMDYESDRWRQDFYRYIRLTLDHADKNDQNDPRSMFYYGSARCYLAFYEGRNGDYFKAISHGLTGIAILKKIVKAAPNFYDAYFGIGSFNYWRSKKTNFLNWLPLVSDNREPGIAMVRQAVDQGKYTRYAAMNELIWILLDAGRSEQAYYWAMQGLKKFPQSRFFQWGAAKSAFAQKNYKVAARHYQQLLISILNAPFDNYYNEYICRVKLAQCFEQMQQYGAAAAQIAVVESLSLSPPVKKRTNKQRQALSRLKKKLSFIAKIESPADSLSTKYHFTDKQRSQ